MNKKHYAVLISIFLFVCISFGSAAELVEPPEYIVSGVIGASMEGAQAPADFALAPNGWYNGGHYKTWVDVIAGYQIKNFHWINYARAGEISINGMTHLNHMLTETLAPGPDGLPQTTVKLLIIGFWGNDFIWLPAYNQQVMDAMVQNVNNQIQAAKNAGVERIIILGWPDYNDLNLDHFITLFPTLTTHVDESGYNQSKNHYYTAFDVSNPDYIFVDPWKKYKTFDGAHPDLRTSVKAALIIMKAIKKYNRLIGR